MLFSLNILKTLVDLENVFVEELTNRLTFSGFEVEETVLPPKIDHLVIGHVISCEDHPDSDHLHVLKVDTKDVMGILDIVCGAKNVRKDLKVILALPGCTLPNGITIKRGVIRGCESNGMCCSLKELGIDDSAYSDAIQNGIFEVDDNIETGRTDVLHALGLDDAYLDINVLANRPDCLSYYGMAREIAALLGRKILFVDNELNTKRMKKGKPITSLTDRCQRFSFLHLKVNKNNFSSPKWLQTALEKFKIRSISPLVDLGNYVMKLTGQPLHIYDLKKCGDYKKIIVRDDKVQDFTALDDKTYALKQGDISICFDDKICCLGGVMGSAMSEVDENTTDIGIEAASFFHQNIRLTSKRLNLISDSSQYFTKKVNPYRTLNALDLIYRLTKEIFSSVKVIDFTDYNKLPKFKEKVRFSLKDCNRRLGSTYTPEQVKEVFDNYNIEILSPNMVKVPQTRMDLVEQCDLEEEIFRYYQAKFIKQELVGLPITKGELTPNQVKQNKVIDTLVNRGLNQIISFTLIDEKMDKLVRVFDNDESYITKNPMTKDHEIVRTDLLPSMIETLDFNVNHRHEDLALFEVSQIDRKKGLKTYLSIGLYGNENSRELLEKRKYDFYDLKGLMEDVMDIYHVDKSRYNLVNSQNPFFHKYISADVIVDKKLVGTFGLVSPKVKGVRPYLLLEMDLSALEEVKSGQFKMAKLSIYPQVVRDFSFVLDKNISYKQVCDTIKLSNSKVINNVELFDYYPLKKDETKVALGIRVSLVNFEKTFSDEEIKVISDKIVAECEKKLNAHLRSLQDE